MEKKVIPMYAIAMLISNMAYTLTVTVFAAINAAIAHMTQRCKHNFNSFNKAVLQQMTLAGTADTYDACSYQQLIRYFIRKHKGKMVSYSVNTTRTTKIEHKLGTETKVKSERYTKTEQVIVLMDYKAWHDKPIQFRPQGVEGIYVLTMHSYQARQKTYRSVDVLVNEARALEDESKSVFYYVADTGMFYPVACFGHPLNFMKASAAWKLNMIPIEYKVMFKLYKPTVKLSKYPTRGEFNALMYKGIAQHVCIIDPSDCEINGVLVQDNRRNMETVVSPYFDNASYRRALTHQRVRTFEEDVELLPLRDPESDMFENVQCFDTDSQLENAIYHRQDQYNPNRDYTVIHVLEAAKKLHDTVPMQGMGDPEDENYIPGLKELFDNDELLKDNSIESISAALIRRYKDEYSVVLMYDGMDTPQDVQIRVESHVK